MTAIVIKPEHMYHPIDLAEMVAIEREWNCDRTDDGDLLADAAGMWGRYQLWFSWHEHMHALTISCAFDTKLPAPMLPRVHALLALVNEKIWVGHFAVSSGDMSVSFRHTLLLPDENNGTSDQLQQLVDIAITECDRFYPALQSATWGGKSPAQALEYSLFETVGEA